MFRALRRMTSNPTVRFFFVDVNGGRTEAVVPLGSSILEAAHKVGVPLEGACDSAMACSTCHVILPDKLFNTLEPACEDEEDMLDMAPCLEETSRLGCQVFCTKEMEDCEIRLPQNTVNFYVDGFVPDPHGH